jgi:antitoxin HicB
MAGSYTVLLRTEPEGGYTVLVPALPGCVTCGDTIDEALRMAEEAIGCHVDALRDLGQSIPQDGPEFTLSAKELTGTLLVYRMSPEGEVAEVA